MRSTPDRGPSHSHATRILDSLDALQQEAADAFCTAVEETLETKDRFCVSLSGGSTPKGLYQKLASRDLPWDRIHWFWGDERNVPHDDAESNTKMVREALLQPASVPEENIHPVAVNAEDPASAAMKYEQTLRGFFSEQTFPQWDLVLLGMGDDAHTASLFPETAALSEDERWFVENWVAKFKSYRYTLSAPAINSGERIWFLISGEGKREALKNVWSGERRTDQFPSQLVYPTRWYLTKDVTS